MKQLKQEILNHYIKTIEEMNRLKLAKDEQIEYLKSRLLDCEYRLRRRNKIERLLFFWVFFVLIGFYLISIQMYLVGLLCMLFSGIYTSYKMIVLAEQNKENVKEIERKKLLSLLTSDFE